MLESARRCCAPSYFFVCRNVLRRCRGVKRRTIITAFTENA